MMRRMAVVAGTLALLIGSQGASTAARSGGSRLPPPPLSRLLPRRLDGGVGWCFLPRRLDGGGSIPGGLWTLGDRSHPSRDLAVASVAPCHGQLPLLWGSLGFPGHLPSLLLHCALGCQGYCVALPGGGARDSVTLLLRANVPSPKVHRSESE